MYLLFDIGGTKMRLATSVDGKEIHESQILPTPYAFDEGIALFKKSAEVLTKGEKVLGCVGGIAGPFNKEKTMLLNPPNMPGWNGQPLKERLEALTTAPVYLENDAALGGLGEAVYGAGQNQRVVVYLAIGTGLGGVRIVDQRIDSSTFGFEPGHQIIDYTSDRYCQSCTVPGHLEAYIGGHSLEKQYHQSPLQINDPIIWDEIAKLLAVGLANTLVHWSADFVVLGGSLMEKIPLDRIQLHLKNTLAIFPGDIAITRGQLQDTAGLYGALAYLHYVQAERK